MSLSYQSLFCNLKHCKWSTTLKKFLFYTIKTWSWELHLLPIIPEAVLVRKNFLIGTLIHRIFFLIVFCPRPQSFKSVLWLTSQVTFQRLPQRQDRGVDRGLAGGKGNWFSNSFVHVYFLWKGKMTLSDQQPNIQALDFVHLTFIYITPPSHYLIISMC